MKQILKKIGQVLKKLFLTKSTLIGVIIGAIIGLIGPKIFVENVKQNFHFEGKPNWVQFRTDSAKINESFNSIPTTSMTGLRAYANGNFGAVVMVKEASFSYGRINSFIDIQDTNKVMNAVNDTGTIYLQESAEDYITPVYFGFDGGEPYYYTKAKIKDFSVSTDDSLISQNMNNKCNADLTIDIPPNNLITIKSINSDITYCLRKKIPSDFFISTPIGNKQRLLNKNLSSDSCKILLISNFADNDTKVDIGSNQLKAIINGGKIRIDSAKYNGDYLIKADLSSQCNSVKLSENPDRPFDIALSLDKLAEQTSYFGLISSVDYFFLTAPSGLFTINGNHYNINSIDKLEVYGKLQLSLVYDGLLIPTVSISGDISSCKLNTQELLKSRWARINSDIRSGIIGGLLGFLLSLITLLFSHKTTANTQYT